MVHGKFITSWHKENQGICYAKCNENGVYQCGYSLSSSCPQGDLNLTQTQLLHDSDTLNHVACAVTSGRTVHFCYYSELLYVSLQAVVHIHLFGSCLLNTFTNYM